VTPADAFLHRRRPLQPCEDAAAPRTILRVFASRACWPAEEPPRGRGETSHAESGGGIYADVTVTFGYRDDIYFSHKLAWEMRSSRTSIRAAEEVPLRSGHAAGRSKSKRPAGAVRSEPSRKANPHRREHQGAAEEVEDQAVSSDEVEPHKLPPNHFEPAGSRHRRGEWLTEPPSLTGKIPAGQSWATWCAAGTLSAV